MTNLTGKKIVLGVTGGIAAYKSAELVRRLRELGASVRVVMTESAQQFITPLTMQALSGNPVHTHLFDLQAEAAMGHIELARWADVIVVVPASADFLAKLAYGHANDLLATLCLATTVTVAVAPAMNAQMWADEATQQNIAVLAQRGITIWGPDAGSQACGEVGYGRMQEPATLLDKLAALFQTGCLSGLRVLVTAGPTQESIDPVRYISNHSSGKMGYAIAQACVEAGAEVLLVSGPVFLTVPEGVTCQQVITAQAMFDLVMSEIGKYDMIIGVAAVADYRCKEMMRAKISKTASTLTLELIHNPDILEAVGALSIKPFIVGFAAETEALVENGLKKLKRKNMDIIIANKVGDEEGGFGSDQNAVTMLWDKGQQEFSMMPKSQLARQIVNLIGKRYLQSEKHSSKNSR